MDHALVIGADTRFGQAVCRRLTTCGFRVFGLARDYKNTLWEHPDFVKLTLDLTSAAEVTEQIGEIQKAGGVFSVVVNATHYLPSQPEFSSIPVGELEATLFLHHTLPIIAARLTLADLTATHGNFIQIVPSTLEGSDPAVHALAAQEPLKAALNALQSGKHHTGLRITHIYATFLGGVKPEDKAEDTGEVKVGIDSQFRLDPEAVADAVEQLIVGRDGNFATEIHLRPRTPRDSKILAREHFKPSGYTAITLPPPEKAAPDQELIPTAKPLEAVDAKDRPVTYVDVIDAYDEEAEEEFERRISGVTGEDEDFDDEESSDDEDENIERPATKKRERLERRGKRSERRERGKKEQPQRDEESGEDKQVSAKTLRNRERRRKWKERKAKERQEAREGGKASEDSNESIEKAAEPSTEGHAAAIAASKPEPESTEQEAPAPKKAAKKKAPTKKKRAAKKAAKPEATEEISEKPAVDAEAPKPAPKKRAAKKKAPAKKKAAAKKKRAPAKKAAKEE